MICSVPYRSEDSIERDSAALLGEYEHARDLTLKPPIPIEDILEKHLNLSIDFDDMYERQNIPRPTNGERDILGSIDPKGSIFIDESLEPEENPAQEGRYRFTLAHEGSHWRLHQSLLNRDTAQSSLLDTADKPTFVCRRSQAKAPEEWQADFYASCLLMRNRPVNPLCLSALVWR